jgi:hypothetical protein
MALDANWRVSQVREYYDRVAVAYIFDEKVFGTIEKMGAFASMVKYTKEDVEIEELLDNEDFVIVDEIVFEHTEED